MARYGHTPQHRRSLSRSLVVVGWVVILLGGLCAVGALYAVSMLGTLDGGIMQQTFVEMLVSPLVALFRGGVLTMACGFVCTIGGGLVLLVV